MSYPIFEKANRIEMSASPAPHERGDTITPCMIFSEKDFGELERRYNALVEAGETVMRNGHDRDCRVAMAYPEGECECGYEATRQAIEEARKP